MQRVGVFVCWCGSNIAGTVDVQAVAAALKNEPGVVFSTDYQYMCSQAGQDMIKDAVKEHNLTGIVVGADDKYIYTIEGNSGDAVRERKYEIGSSAYSKISGWVRMNEWSGGTNNVAQDTYLANNNSEDADKEKRSTI